jgi:creatinine amidohydrolase
MLELMMALWMQPWQGVDAPRPIEAETSVWTEEMTWMEVRDAVKAGRTTIVIGTGGIEQNGPYVAGGKHNYVLELVLPYVARALGNALVAPVVRFVPEGRIEPAEGHMRYAGTISVEESTFVALLRDVCRSYRAHGFRNLVLVGDSGGNQKGMERVAAELNALWKGRGARVHYLKEFYTQDPWSYAFLKKKGIVQREASTGSTAAAHTRDGIHDDIYYEAQLAAIDPRLIRAEQRRQAGLMSLHGVKLEPLEKLRQLGRELAEYRAGIVKAAYERSLKGAVR